MGVAAKNTSIDVAIACWYWGSYFPEEERMKGIRLRWADYRLPDLDDRAVPVDKGRRP